VAQIISHNTIQEFIPVRFGDEARLESVD